MSEESKVSEEKYYPGLEGVIAGETAISSVLGGLQYRGYAIEDLAENATFEQVAYLVLYGDLPTPAQLGDFKARLAATRELPRAVIDMIRLRPKEAPAMDVLRSGVSTLAHFDAEANLDGRDANLRKAERLLARIPTLIATRHRLKHGREPLPARQDFTHAANLLYMITGKEPPSEH